VKLCDRREARKKALELAQFAYEERQKARKAEEAKQEKIKIACRALASILL
jgi:hypothetical protein